MNRFLKWAGRTALCLSLAAPVSCIAATCDGFLPGAQPDAEGKRNLLPDDLVRLRDIGSKSYGDVMAPILAVSPDGKQVAFQLRRGDPDTDAFCLGMLVISVSPNTSPHLVDRGGDYMRLPQDLLGTTNVPTGYTDVIAPVWSPDGTTIAYRRRDNGPVQVWIAKADGSGARAVTSVPFDVEKVAWAADGKGLVFNGRPGLADAEHAIAEEGREGYLFDNRYIPFAGNRPFPPATVAREAFLADVATGKVREATSAEANHLVPSNPIGLPADAQFVVPGLGGQVAWSTLSDPQNVVSPTRLHVRDRQGKNWDCEMEACLLARGVWWYGDDAILFQRREGWAKSETGLYEWHYRTGRVRQIINTPDVLEGCQIAIAVLVCAHEGSRQPKEIVAIDLASGRLTTLFDPNPEFRHIKLGSVQRLKWKNAFGVEGFGDLVLPPDHQPGQKHPLVVVQYESRGFLRGGTDDEYPIQLLAANGIAVLSFEDLLSPGYIKGGASWGEINRYDYEDWRGRRSTLESLEAGLKLAIAGGAVDGQRLGITGLSAGSNNTRWALLNSHLFSAAAISTCCEDVTSIMTTYGPAGADSMRKYGYPRITDDGAAFWGPASMRVNARRMKTPLLMQLSDNEYLAALESYTALREQQAPVEIYVFPDEYHEKWHPAHRRAIYDRAVDWFKFWLDNTEDTNPAKQDQYKRWRSLRANLPGPGASPGA